VTTFPNLIEQSIAVNELIRTVRQAFREPERKRVAQVTCIVVPADRKRGAIGDRKKNGKKNEKNGKTNGKTGSERFYHADVSFSAASVAQFKDSRPRSSFPTPFFVPPIQRLPTPFFVPDPFILLYSFNDPFIPSGPKPIDA
jgi:hypothetical protein